MEPLGRYFHIFKNGEIRRQGKILSVDGSRIKVQWFNWTDGELADRATIPTVQIDGRWRFYSTTGQMCAAYEKLNGLQRYDASWPDALHDDPLPVLGKSRRFTILKRDDYRCQICGNSVAEDAQLEVDHIIPRSKGGTDDPENLWTVMLFL